MLTFMGRKWQGFTAVLIGCFLSVSSVAAQAPSLSLPLDCSLGETCFVQQFVDHDPGKGAADFACGAATYDGHKGTDFRLPTEADMLRGVAVLAAAPGRVLGVRDGMRDHRVNGAADIARIKGRECGNGVVLDHGDGWRTQYCHLKNGSVLVHKGDLLERGQRLGLVGLSGNTQFPHVHLSVNKDEQIIDPFQTQKVNKCGVYDANNLWGPEFPTSFQYQPTVVVLAGFAASAAKYDRALAGDYDDLSALARNKPLVALGLIINLRVGDVFEITLSGPKGVIAETKSPPFDKNKAQWMSFTGKTPPSGGWPKGDYKSVVSVLRAGQILNTKIRYYQMK